MPSKRERDYARRRYEKSAARAARAARLRRERQLVVLFTVLGFVVLVGAVWLLNRTADDPTDVPTDATVTTDAPTDATTLDPLPTTNPDQWDAPPPASDSLNKDWDVTITTSAGDITMVLHGADAPQAVANFVFLAQQGFYDGTACHRLAFGALLQCGDPTATGTGGPGYEFGPVENAPDGSTYVAGTVAMARSVTEDSMGSQFFLVFADTELGSEDGLGYSVFGEITGGLDVLQEIGAAGTTDGGTDGRPATDVIITGVEVE